jgi:hypothetical protein
VYAGNGKRSENPDEVVGHEKVRTTGPPFGVTVIALQPLHALLAGNIVPRRECGNGGVVEDHKSRAPPRKGEACDISLEIICSKSLSYDSLPAGHSVLLRILSARCP